MKPAKYPSLPNPTKSNDPDWTTFSAYLKTHSITEQKTPAIDAYQNAESGNYVSAETLNHYLTLIEYEHTSNYAEISCAQLGAFDDYDYNHSLNELDAIFTKNSCAFDNKSIVYKGIGSAPYYEILNLGKLKQGEKIKFPGFLSTSVCREKAESFARSESPILLEITGLEQAQAIIPENKKVLNSPTPDIPEQEVLLNRGLTFDVIDNQLGSQRVRVLKIKLCSS